MQAAKSMQIRCPISTIAAACMSSGMPVKGAGARVSGNNIGTAGWQGVLP